MWHRIKLFILLGSALIPAALYAETACLPIGSTIPQRSSLASAGFFANLRNSESSLNYIMDSMLTEAFTNRSSMATEHPVCPNSCGGARLAIEFDSTPNLRRSGYSDSDACEKLEAETKRNPILYQGRIFDSADEAKDWYHDLTQGDGPDGEDLYQRCPGSCSPSYASTILKNSEKLLVTTSIVCGHARDRDDNQYRLTYSFRWICP